VPPFEFREEIMRGQLIAGLLLLFFGVLWLIGNIFQIDFWTLCWPTGLILVGLWLLFRPKMHLIGLGNVHLIGEQRREGRWSVVDEDIWTFVSDIHLDLSLASLPPGETTLRIYGFVGDVDLLIPREVGVAISSNAFYTEGKVLGESSEKFLSGLNYTSPNYNHAERRLRLELSFFVVDLDVRSTARMA
jgi:predicted membrane protein